MTGARSTRLAWLIVSVAAAVVFVGVAVPLQVAASGRAGEADRLAADADRVFAEARELTENVDQGNTALTDAAATGEAVDQLRTAVEESFSYDYADLAATQRAVDRYLTGKGRCAYDRVFAEVKELAPKQKIVMVTGVRDIALVRLAGDRAQALVFIDQTSTRKDVGTSSAGAAQFAVRAQREGAQWKITELDMFDQPLVNGKPAPTC